MSKLSCNAARDLLPLYVDGVLSPETAQEVRRHLETCEACRRERDRLTGVLTLPLSESVGQESAKPLRSLKRRVRNGLILAAALTVVLAAGAWLLSRWTTMRGVEEAERQEQLEQDRVEALTWQDGLSTQALAPGETLVSDYEVPVDEGQAVYLFMNWARSGLVVQMGLIAPDGAEYATDPRAGGHDDCAFQDLPAGTYRLFIRNAGDYSDLPAYKDPENFPEVSYNAFCVMNYAVG